MELLDTFKRTRQTAVPLVGISCFDPADVITKLRTQNEEGAKTPIPLCTWDAMDGLKGLNKYGDSAVGSILSPGFEKFDDAKKREARKEWAQLTANPSAALAVISELPGEVFDAATNERVVRGTIVFALNLHRYFEDKPSGENGQVVQGIWNLRDRFKANRRTLVILGPSFNWPAEITNDVITIDVPLPSDADLKNIIETQVKDSGLAELAPKKMEQAIDAVRGLPSAFAVEQNVSMCLTKEGLVIDNLWERKISTIEQTAGLTVDRGSETFDDAGGLNQFKSFGLRLIKSEKAPLLYVRIDEIEKFLGGLGGNGQAGDNTGIAQDSLGVFLREMEDNGWNGMIALGHPGCAKSLITKGLANTATVVSGRRVLSVAMDLGATKNSLVGESEKRLRALFKVIKAVGGKRVCFVATCNDLEVMPPALRRRFKLGMWMFDLPNREQKDEIWSINLKKFGLERPATLPDDTDWTGSDIRNVCEQADLLGCNLDEACQYVVFVAKNDPESITRLRNKADGKYLDANRPGVYRVEEQEQVAVAVADRPTQGRARRDETA
jgi:hypothetical protein